MAKELPEQLEPATEEDKILAFAREKGAINNSECQALLVAILDERRHVVDGHARRVGVQENAPAHSIHTDTVHGRARVLSKRPMRDGGFVVDERSLIDQHGEVVQQGKFTFLVAKRKEVRV